MTENLQDEMLRALPIELFKFLDTLTGNELHEIDKLEPHLVAKIYQAGAIFAIDTGIKLGKKIKEPQV